MFDFFKKKNTSEASENQQAEAPVAKGFWSMALESFKQTISKTSENLVDNVVEVIDDKDELAMPLMGYGADDDTAIGEFDKSDFLEAMAQSGISANVSKNILNKFHRYKPKWFSLIDSSFLSENIKGIYKALIEERLEKIVG